MIDVTYEQVIDLVKSLPADRLSSLYDFARYLKESTPEQEETADLFGETPEEVSQDEAWWDAQFGRSADTLLRLAEEAVDEYKADKTTPIDIDEQGHLRR